MVVKQGTHTGFGRLEPHGSYCIEFTFFAKHLYKKTVPVTVEERFELGSGAYLDWEIDVVFCTKRFAIVHTINHHEAGGNGDRANNNYFQDFSPSAHNKPSERKSIILKKGTTTMLFTLITFGEKHLYDNSSG